MTTLPAPRPRLDPVGAVYFWFFISIGSYSPFIYLYYLRAGMDAGEIKLLAALAPLVALVTQPLWGALADLLHARRAILALCLGGNALAALLFLQAGGFYPLLGTVALFALFQGGVLPLVNSCAIAAGGQETGFGTRRLWGTISFIIASSLAGALALPLGLRVIFPLAAFGLATALLVTLRLPATAVRPASRVRFLAGVRLFWRDRTCRWFVFGLLLLGITIEGNFVTYGLMWNERNGSDAALGFGWSLAALGEIPLFYWGTRLLARCRPLCLLGIAGLLAALRWGSIMLLHDWRWLLATQPLHALMYACYLWGAVHFIDVRSRASVKNTGQALVAIVIYGLATIAGCWLGGQLYESYGTLTVYAVFTGGALLAALVFLRAARTEATG